MKRLDAACRRAERRWSDPRAVARKLGPPAIRTTASRSARRKADTLRGYRAVLQDVVDVAARRPRPREDAGVLARYRIALSKATTELEGDELVLRQDWGKRSQAPVIRRNLRSARRYAARYGADECAELRTEPF